MNFSKPRRQFLKLTSLPVFGGILSISFPGVLTAGNSMASNAEEYSPQGMAIFDGYPEIRTPGNPEPYRPVKNFTGKKMLADVFLY